MRARQQPLAFLALVVAVTAGCAGGPAGQLAVQAAPTLVQALAQTTGQPAVAMPVPTVATLAQQNPALDANAIAQDATPGLLPTTDASAAAAPDQAASAQDPVTTANSAKLFVSPAETLPALEAEIAASHHSIYLETFNFGTSYAQRLAPQLIAKAQKGVEVRVLVDYLGSRFLKGYDKLVEQLTKGHVDVQVYKPHRFKDKLGHQSFGIIHRKVYLFDGNRALVGGVNLASPFDTTTQDLLIRWQGPILGSLYQEFKHDWQGVSKTTLATFPVTTPAGNVDAQVLVTNPDEGRYEIRDAVTAHIDAARSSILIENQYLWDDDFLSHLVAACKRGVQVRVLLPGVEQKSVQRRCNEQSMNTLIAAGGQARRYNAFNGTAHLHTKYYAIDDAWVATGSCNADTRSLTDNHELDIITTNTALIADLRARLFEADWQDHSVGYTPHPVTGVSARFDNLLDLLDYYM